MHSTLKFYLRSTYFEHSSVYSQEDLYLLFYGISFMHPYKQSRRWLDMFEYQVGSYYI